MRHDDQIISHTSYLYVKHLICEQQYQAYFEIPGLGFDPAEGNSKFFLAVRQLSFSNTELICGHLTQGGEQWSQVVSQLSTTTGSPATPFGAVASLLVLSL